MDKSKGHIIFHDKYEYFEISNGDVYKAPKDHFIMTDGYRSASRFECTKAAWPLRYRLLTMEEIIRQEPA